MNNIQAAYSYFIGKGLSPNAAAGIVGNLKAESNVDPNSNQADGPGRGIAQWSEGGRWESLKAWADGRDITSLQTQLDFLWHELQTGYRHVLIQLQNTTNMAQATAVFMKEFEIPADTSASAVAGRVALAEDVRSNNSASAARIADGGGNTTGGGTAGKQDNLSPQEMAEQYGWAMSFLKSQPELWDLFQQAVKQDWSPQQFAAKLRDTKWYQKNSETVRQNLLLKETDPATYQDRLQEIRATIRDLAGTSGAQLSDNQLDRVAENALMFGWSDSQIQNTMAQYIERVKGSFVGEAGSAEDELMAYARNMGVKVDGSFIKKSVEQIGAGNWDMNRAKDHISKIAMSQFPTIREDIKAGLTVMDVASSYINSMSSLLELNPADVDLFEPKIRRALAAKGKDGRPEMKTIWEFEQDLRQDPRWQKTSNAQDQVASVARQIASDFGLGW